VVYSINRGTSFALTVAAPSANTVQAIDVRDNSRWWVGDGAGGVYYTLNGGNTWVTKVLGSSPTDIRDIKFLNDEVGWATGATTTPYGLLYATWNGGRDWTDTGLAPRMTGIPVSSANFQRGDRIAIPTAANIEASANNVLICGLGATTDGI
jgi:photosystem II stability/assembly factor-like uncharacterized protein